MVIGYHRLYHCPIHRPISITNSNHRWRRSRSFRMFLAGSARQPKPSSGGSGSPLLVGFSSATCFHMVPAAARPAEWSRGPKSVNKMYTLERLLGRETPGEPVVQRPLTAAVGQGGGVSTASGPSSTKASLWRPTPSGIRASIQVESHTLYYYYYYYFCMTQETVRRLPFRCYTRKGSDLDQSQQTNKGKDKTSEINESGKN